jgi:hypothetical protein
MGIAHGVRVEPTMSPLSWIPLNTVEPNAFGASTVDRWMDDMFKNI